MDRALPRELNRDLKQATERSILPTARADAPHLSGRLARSLQAYTRGNKAGIRSRLPYGNAIHWGWPRHHIHANPFIERAFSERGEQLVDAVGDAIEGFADRHGWR